MPTEAERGESYNKDVDDDADANAFQATNQRGGTGVRGAARVDSQASLLALNPNLEIATKGKRDEKQDAEHGFAITGQSCHK